jgi:hypothetical protein
MEEMRETKGTRQTKPQRKGSANASALSAAAPAADAAAIARRAHELFQARGGLHGHDMDDWLEAERQIGGQERKRRQSISYLRTL